MPLAVAHRLPREMAVLGLLELVLSFSVIYTVIQVAASVPLPVVAGMGCHACIALAATLTLITGGGALTIGLYRPDVCVNRKRLLTATGVAAIATFAVLLLIDEASSNRFGIAHTLYTAKVIAAWLASVALLRLGYGFAIGRGSLVRSILLVGDPDQVGTLAAHVRSCRGRLFDPVMNDGKTVPLPLLRGPGIRGVMDASEPTRAAVETLLDCERRGVRILSRGVRILNSAAFRENYSGRVDLDALTASHLRLGQSLASGNGGALVKRLFDMTVAILMLVLSLPLMAITTLAIKIESPGPVFYRQQRVGRSGTTFTLLKFRSMAADGESNFRPRHAREQYSRTTRIGRIIRVTRIDELPQLVNVIRGEMSLVGPRPERPHMVEQLARAIPCYHWRTNVKPGLTGWAQVNFPYGAAVEDAREKLAYDLYYVRNRTVILDMIILISTIRIVLFRGGVR